MAVRRSLVIGGTGPSGYCIVERLIARGDDVAICPKCKSARWSEPKQKTA